MSTDSTPQKPHPRKDTSTPSPSSSGDIPVIPFAEPDPSAFDTGNPEIDAAFTSAFAPIQDDAPVVPSVTQPSEPHPGSFDMTAGSPSNSGSMDPAMASAFTAPESAVPTASSTSGTETATGKTTAMPKFDPKFDTSSRRPSHLQFGSVSWGDEHPSFRIAPQPSKDELKAAKAVDRAKRSRERDMERAARKSRRRSH